MTFNLGTIMCIVGSVFTLIGIITVIPTKKNSKNYYKVKGTIISCMQEKPNLENALEFSETININDTKFNYTIVYEYYYEGNKCTRSEVISKKMEIGDTYNTRIPYNEGETVEKRKVGISGSQIGGILGIVIGIIFIVLSVMKVF